MEPPYMQLAQMSRWYVVSRAIHAVANLGIANHLSETPVPVTTLADLTDTKPELLDRLLKYLSTYQIFRYHDGGYAITPLSKPLRDDDPHSLRDVLCMVDKPWWEAFSELDTCLKTGESAFSLQHNDTFFNFLSQSPDQQARFDKGMAKLSSYDDDLISCVYPFDRFVTLVDMGGGRGGMIRSLHQHYPSLQLTLFDTPAVIDNLDADEFPDNTAFVAGDFFKAIPHDKDAYLFKGVLHDFDDDNMRAILKNSRSQMPDRSTLLIAEQILPEEAGPHPNKTMDIVMMVLLGGRQRTLSSWREVVEPLGFTFQAHYPTDGLFTVMAFQPK